MQDIKDGEVAVWKHGMTKAFELLRKANNCALCQQAIMVLSDGTTSSLSDLFKENNADKKVYVGYTAWSQVLTSVIELLVKLKNSYWQICRLTSYQQKTSPLKDL